MLTDGLCNRVTFFLLGCLATSAVVFTGASYSGTVPSSDVAPQVGAIADLRVESRDIQVAGARRAFAVLKDGQPLLFFYENHSGEIDKFSVMNCSKETIVALGELGTQGISRFTVYGNSFGEKEQTPALMLTDRDASGRWDIARYSPMVPRGEKDYFPIVGEMYEDIDCDGQFDAKRVYSAKSDVVSESIFLNGKWKEICCVNEDGLFLKIGQSRSEDHNAFFTEGQQRIHYVFQPGFGWRVDRTEPASIKWRALDGTLIDDVTRIRGEQGGVLMRFPERGNPERGNQGQPPILSDLKHGDVGSMA